MNFIEEISKEKFENFVSTHQKSHFMQSYYWGDIQKNKKFVPHYVGVTKGTKLVAAALILEKRIYKNINFLYCPRGFVCDYTDTELVDYFLKSLKSFAKRRKSIFLRMDPDLILNSLDDNAQIKEKNESTYNLFEIFKKNKLIHKGFNKNFENNQPRFTFRLDLNKDWDSIYGGFHPTTRKILNKNNPFDLKIQKGSEKDLKDFYITMIETAKRENIIPSKIEYYETFYKIFNSNGMSDLYLVKCNIKSLKKLYLEKINSIKEEKKDLNKNINQNAKKNAQKLETMEKQIEKLEREYENLNLIKEKELTLSSIITVKYKDMVWTVHGGNHSLLRELNANYLIYEKIIKDAHEEGYKRIDLFGTTGDPNEKNPVYGIYLFKKRLGGEYIEFIGEFDYINNKTLYFLYTKLLPKVRCLLKK